MQIHPNIHQLVERNQEIINKWKTLPPTYTLNQEMLNTYDIKPLDKANLRLRQPTAQWNFHIANNYQEITEQQSNLSGCQMSSKLVYKAKAKDTDLFRITNSFHMGDYYAISQYMQICRPDQLPIHCILVDQAGAEVKKTDLEPAYDFSSEFFSDPGVSTANLTSPSVNLVPLKFLESDASEVVQQEDGPTFADLLFRKRYMRIVCRDLDRKIEPIDRLCTPRPCLSKTQTPNSRCQARNPFSTVRRNLFYPTPTQPPGTVPHRYLILDDVAFNLGESPNFNDQGGAGVIKPPKIPRRGEK